MDTRQHKTVPLGAGEGPKTRPSRSAAAQRRSMQAALTAALTALRSYDARRGGRRPPQGLV